MRNTTLLLGCLGAAGLLLAGCGARTEVSQSGNAPAQYSHVYITTQEVWFNTSATAGPDDTGWQKFPLTTPATVDLVGDEDVLTPPDAARSLADRINGAQLEILAGAGHLSNLEQPEAFNRVVRDFLEQLSWY